MRVAFVTKRADGGGAARRLRWLAERLGARGHEVCVFCARWWEGTESTLERPSVTYRAVVEEDSSAKFAARLPFALRRYGPDVVHAAASPPAAVAAARTGGAPLVVEWVDPVQESRLAGARRRAADAVVTPSEFVRTEAREAGFPGETVRVIPPSVPMAAVREAAVREGADLVCARRLDGDASLGSLFLALAEFRDRGWTAAVVGDGPERSAYEREAADLRIDDRVTFAGSLPVSDRLELYRGAHVFVQTAARERTAEELRTALACGCVGVVQYRANSCAHEPVEGYDRGFRATDEAGVTEAIAAAGGLDRWTIDERFDAEDERATVERYLTCYRDLRGR